MERLLRPATATDWDTGSRWPRAVLFLYQVTEPMLGLLPLIILLFPDGRLPSPGGAGCCAAT